MPKDSAASTKKTKSLYAVACEMITKVGELKKMLLTDDPEYALKVTRPGDQYYRRGRTLYNTISQMGMITTVTKKLAAMQDPAEEGACCVKETVCVFFGQANASDNKQEVPK